MGSIFCKVHTYTIYPQHIRAMANIASELLSVKTCYLFLFP